VRVTDDGHGMSRADLVLSVVRHATSKLRRFEDLQAIRSLGFRGEALPSIAAVSRLRLASRRREDDSGSLLTLEGGAEPHVEDCGTAAGTDVQVRDLFYNTPVRRKFLRTAATEMGHISAWTTHLGLARREVHLRLTHNGRKVIDAPGNPDLAQRVAALLGREVFEHLHPIFGQQPGIQVEGLVSAPTYSRPNTRGIHLFVNGRFVRDRSLQYAIMDGYRTVLPERRFPLVVVSLELDPELVDVNVHPQKIEVRFADTRQVQSVLRRAIGTTLADSPWVDFGSQAMAEAPTRSYRLAAGQGEASSPEAEQQAERVRVALGRFAHSQAGLSLGRPVYRGSGSVGAQPGLDPMAGALGGVGQSGADAAELPLSQWRIAGTIWNTYIALYDQRRLIFVDQHAAHERITFEGLCSAVDGDGVRSQRLLVPVQMELEPSLLAVVEADGSRLFAIGFEIEIFGPGVVMVSAVPALLSNAPVVELVRDALDELAESERLGAWEDRRIAVLSRMACHGSVRAGQALSEPEIRSLLEQLEGIDFAGLCPHGRPVLVEFGRGEVEHWFHRG
jgi:DNA mismatch repair protein MutL